MLGSGNHSFLCGLLALTLTTKASFAQDSAAAESAQAIKLQCASAYEQTQRKRQAGEWLEARQQALSCAQEQCPGVLSQECQQWLGELEGTIPSHVFRLETPEGDVVSGASISLDGGDAEPNDGLPRFVNPGSHRVVFQTSEGQQLGVDFDAAVGQQNVLVTGRLPKADAEAPERAKRRFPAGSWVLTGVGVAGVGAFAGFALAGNAEKSQLEERCSPSAPCPEEEGRRAKNLYLAADISLAVGLTSLATGLAVWLLAPQKPKQEKPQVSLQLGASPTSSSLTLSGSF